MAESLDRFIERTLLCIIICPLCGREVGKEVWLVVCPEFEPRVAWSRKLKVLANWGRYNSGSRSLIGDVGLSCMGIEWH
jgi:hypothetical protein